MAGNLPRERWMRPPVMSKDEVDSWIDIRKTFYSSTYDDLLMGRSRARAELSDPRVPVDYREEAIKNHDLITARLEELSREEDQPSSEPRINSKIMTKKEVDAWIAYRKSLYSATYDELLMGRERTRAELADPQVPRDYRVEQIKNHDLITARLEELLRNEKIDKVNRKKGATAAIGRVFEERGQTGDPTLGPVGTISKFLGGKKRTLKKRKQKKRTAKRKNF